MKNTNKKTNTLRFNFDKVIEFKQEGTKLLECFFFQNNQLITSNFLTLAELNDIKKGS